MLAFKNFFIRLISITFVCGIAVLVPPAYQAAAAGFWSQISAGKCNVIPTWLEIFRGKKRWVQKFGGTAYCDRETGLVWEAKPSTALFVWGPEETSSSGRPNAIDHCANLALSGQSWRLPKVKEYISLLDYQKIGRQDIALNADPFDDVQDTTFGYWSQTELYGSSGSSAWVVEFKWGKVIHIGTNPFDGPDLHAWCVSDDPDGD